MKITFGQAESLIRYEIKHKLKSRKIEVVECVGGPHVGTPCYIARFDSYDGAEDSNHPKGTGATAQEALDAFIEELERRAG